MIKVKAMAAFAALGLASSATLAGAQATPQSSMYGSETMKVSSPLTGTWPPSAVSHVSVRGTGVDGDTATGRQTCRRAERPRAGAARLRSNGQCPTVRCRSMLSRLECSRGRQPKHAE